MNESAPLVTETPARRYFDLWPPRDRAALIDTFGSLEDALTSGLAPIATESEVLEMHTQSDDELLQRPPIAIFFPKQPGAADVPEPELVALAERLGPAAFIALIVDGRQEYLTLEKMDTGKVSGSTRAVEKMRASFAALLDQILASIKETSGTRQWPIAVRDAYFTFTRDYMAWRAELSKSYTTTNVFATVLPKQTSQPLNRIEQAYGKRDFVPTMDGRALVQRAYTKERKRDPIDVMIEPLETPQWFPPATVGELNEKLARIGSHSTFAFAVIVSLALENERVHLDLDDLIKFLGLDPRSTRERREYHATLWECLQLFSQTSAVGELQGRYRDARGNLITRIEQSPVIAITGSQYPVEMRLDRSEPPIAVSFVAGDFFYRHRGNRKLLAYYGDLRQLASIPSGKTPGQWARCIGLALSQFWREQSANAEVRQVGNDHLTARFRKVTRREIFDCILPEPSPYNILKGSNPKHARDYWNQAIAMLQEQKFATVVGGTGGEYPRKDWQNAWLDEELDVRPHHGNVLAITATQELASSAKAFKRKRGRPKKT